MVKDKKLWRVIDVLKWSKQYLADYGVESPQIEVEWILRDVLDCSRLDLYMKHERPLDSQELSRIRKYLKKRTQGQPIQYVLGYTEFYGYKFEVNSDVLIPRPETELIVERIVKNYKKKEGLKILDIGTGSGNIIISLVKELPKASGLGLDVSKEALETANKNSKINNTESDIEFIQMDILNEIPDRGKFDILVSNPPYISAEKYEELAPHVKDHEPEWALKPEQDELIFYRRIHNISDRIIKPGGLLALEIGGTYQEKSVTDIFSEKFNKIEILEDYQKESRAL